jgi:hypothetical protein
LASAGVWARMRASASSSFGTAVLSVPIWLRSCGICSISDCGRPLAASAIPPMPSL